MDKNLIATQSVEINSSKEKIWEVLTNPEKIKVYLFGTETITDWKGNFPIENPIIYMESFSMKNRMHQYKL